MNETRWIDVTSKEAVWRIHDRMVKPVPVVSLGLRDLDRAMMTWGMGKGLPRGTYMIVGGASNIGKTQYGLHLLKNAAQCGERAGLVSLDMKGDDALLRIHQSLVGSIPRDSWRPDRWKEGYEVELEEGLRQWRLSVEGDIGIWATSNQGDLDWVRYSLEQGIEAGATYFVVDHLQKVRVSGFRDSEIHARAEVVSETLDRMTDEFGVTIVGLSQLNREASKQRDRRPQMSDLWGGTAMESNAQVVILLDHSRYERDPKQHYLGKTWLLLDKNQMGPKAIEVPVEWNHITLELREAEPDELDQWPDGKRRR